MMCCISQCDRNGKYRNTRRTGISPYGQQLDNEEAATTTTIGAYLLPRALQLLCFLCDHSS